ncbi:hypothetical protein PCE1_000767 [Barthelona sp. PCE]
MNYDDPIIVQQQLEMLRLQASQLLDTLSPELKYHDKEHSLKWVYEGVCILTEHFQVPARETFLLKVAAYFHDTGFLEQYDNNEPLGANIAERVLKQHNYSTEDIDFVREMILETAIFTRKEPSSFYGQLIRDADIYHLSVFEGYEDRCLGLMNEQVVIKGREWASKLDFVKENKEFVISMLKYHTDYAKENWSDKMLNVMDRLVLQFENPQ